MVSLIAEIGLSRVGNNQQFVWETRHEVLKHVASRKMLQAFIGMRDIAVKRHLGRKKSFLFFYLPDSKLREFIDMILKKQRHVQD